MRTAVGPTSLHIIRGKTTVHGEKRISDSFCEVLLPFRTDATLLEEYVSMHGGLRFGKLLEDLDALAASIAYLHCDDAGLTLVTAAVDRIDLLKQFDSVVSDIRMRGFVTYVGTSSMEVTMAVDMDESNGWELAALAKFVFVARSQDGSIAVKVPRLVLETTREQEIYDLGKARHKYRLSRSAQSLFHQPPTEKESMILHRLLMRPDSDAHVWPMRSTEMTSLRICHPQERNIHNFIFGGYLMREAFELAYSTAALFTRGAALTVTTVDDVTFVHPVAIGSMLSFCARIVYTDQCPAVSDRQRLHVEVVADVIDPKNGTRVTTNTFHYTFTRSTTDFSTVLPETYTEAMRYLEGKRRVESQQE
jgi:acyl-coenzyme A thioesterase 9